MELVRREMIAEGLCTQDEWDEIVSQWKGQREQIAGELKTDSYYMWEKEIKSWYAMFASFGFAFGGTGGATLACINDAESFAAHMVVWGLLGGVAGGIGLGKILKECFKNRTAIKRDKLAEITPGKCEEIMFC